MKLKNSWFTDLKNKRRDRENQDCTIFCPHVSLCVFSPQHFLFCFFFCIFMSFLFFVFLVALGNFVFAVTHCRTPTQKKKNTVIRERQILLYSDFLSVCMTRGTVTQTNPIIITWKRRESEKKKWQKEKKTERRHCWPKRDVSSTGPRESDRRDGYSLFDPWSHWSPLRLQAFVIVVLTS